MSSIDSIDGTIDGTIDGDCALEGAEGSQEKVEHERISHRPCISAAVSCSAFLPLPQSLSLCFATIILAVIETREGLALRPLTIHRAPLHSHSSIARNRNPPEPKKYMSDDVNKFPSFQLQLQTSRPGSPPSKRQIIQVANMDQQPNDELDFIESKQQLPQAQIQFETLSRILIPSFLSSVLAYTIFPSLALGLSYLINDSATFAVLSVDSSQFIQNFLTVTGLTFSILVGQTYYFMYQQQEAVFVSLFWEVTEAKSLLEQVALVSQGRRDMYEMCLIAVKRYVEEDLKDGLGKAPAKVLSARPMDDPLETIMYMTSVGVPSSIYDTVRSLRQARARRLGALQKKLPSVHLLLLWLLAIIELSSFPVLGAGTQTIGGYNILTIEGFLFGIMTFGIVLTLNIVGELYAGSGGAYNVDSVLRVMVNGLDEELETRMNDIDMDIMRPALMSFNERTEMEERKGLPSPVYYPVRYSKTYFGEDSVEANSI